MFGLFSYSASVSASRCNKSETYERWTRPGIIYSGPPAAHADVPPNNSCGARVRTRTRSVPCSRICAERDARAGICLRVRTGARATRNNIIAVAVSLATPQNARRCVTGRGQHRERLCAWHAKPLINHWDRCGIIRCGLKTSKRVLSTIRGANSRNEGQAFYPMTE